MASAPVPPVQQYGHAVLIQGPALTELAYLATLGARVRKNRDGIAPSRATRALLEALADAGQVIPYDAAPAIDPAALVDPVDTAGAAEILSVSTRRVQQLADDIGCHRHGRALAFDRGAVLAYHAQRTGAPT
jgi:hypothetical protein